MCIELLKLTMTSRVCRRFDQKLAGLRQRFKCERRECQYGRRIVRNKVWQFSVRRTGKKSKMDSDNSEYRKNAINQNCSDGRKQGTRNAVVPTDTHH